MRSLPRVGAFVRALLATCAVAAPPISQITPTSLAASGGISTAVAETVATGRASLVNGLWPSELILSRDGDFYGGTDHGGEHNQGIFFKMTAGGDVTQLSSFGGANGINPRQTSWVEGVDGNFYGLIYSLGPGGPYPPHPQGAVVRITREGVSTFFADFAPTGASSPLTLTAGSDGNLYGTTADTTAERGGSVFRVDQNGSITILGRFPAPYSHGKLVEASDGNFYGVIYPANSFVSSTPAKLFQVTRAGDISVFHDFDPAVEGTRASELVAGPDGRLYGSTFADGPKGNGSIYQIELSGVVTIFHDQGFSNLVAASDGNFYGATSIPRGRGMIPDTLISRITSEGATPLYTFVSHATSVSSFVAGPNGTLYGTTARFDGTPQGAIFCFDPAEGFAFIYRFRATSGDVPASALVPHPDGHLYGTAADGGVYNLGSVFAITPAGESVTIASFRGSNGRKPHAALVRASDGNFYGTTAGGGIQDGGTVFRVTPAGELQSIFSFPPGLRPFAAPLVEGADGALYGTTPARYAGPAGGIIFRITTSGSFSTFATIPNGDVCNPAGGLVRGADANLYGLTTSGTRTSGEPLPGAVYQVTGDGVSRTIASFSSSDGVPSGEPVVSSDGFLYAHTVSGVSDNRGAIFRLSPDGEKTTVYRFDPAERPFALGFLSIGSDGNLYMPIGYRVAPTNARILRITPQGIALTVATYDDAGIVPASKLAEASDHQFYGTTHVVSASRWTAGTVYRVRLLAPQITGITSADATAGAQIVISGRFFTGALRVSFAGALAERFSVESDVQITATLPAGGDASAVSVTTPTGVATFPNGAVPSGPALNISTRVRVGTADNAVIGGFIVTGNLPKKLVVRAIGPSLGAANVAGALLNPTLDLHNGRGDLIASNDDWTESSQAEEISATGIPPGDSRESAIVATLEPGSYTAVVRGVADTEGVGLVEVYDLDPKSGRLANIATRGLVQTGSDVMIGGFIIGGDAPAKTLLRAIGPSLSKGAMALADALLDPQVELRDADGNLMGSNNNWQESAQRQQIEATTTPPSEPAEAAIVATLNPGNYTAIVSGVNGSTGVGLIEVYMLD